MKRLIFNVHPVLRFHYLVRQAKFGIKQVTLVNFLLFKVCSSLSYLKIVSLSIVGSKRFLITVGGNSTTGKCLDIAGGDAILHSQIQLFRCHGKENQQFEFHRDGTIRVMGKCLDIPDSQAYDHQGVQLFDCRANQKNQQFMIDTDNRIHVMGKCLDVPNGQFVNNNPLQLFRCHTLASQRFYFAIV